MKPLLPLMIVCCTLASCTAGVHQPDGRVREFLGQDAIDVLSQPKRVEVFHVRDMRATGGKAPPDAPQVMGFEITAVGQIQGEEFGAEFAKIFFSKRTYLFDIAKGCIFHADTVVRVHGPDDKRVVFVLCFGCAEFDMSVYDVKGTYVHGGANHFNAVAEKLEAIVARAFPATQPVSRGG